MKNKRTLIICTIIIVLLAISTSVLALDTNQYKPTDPTDTEEFTEIGGNFISIIQFVGILLAVIMIAVIGIKYMLGSVEEKAEFKQTMGPYIVGCILLVCSSALVGVIGNTISSDEEKSASYSNEETARESAEKEAKSFISKYGKNEPLLIDEYFKACRNFVTSVTQNEKDFWGFYDLEILTYINGTNIKKGEYFKEKMEEHKEWVKENDFKDIERTEGIL